MAACLSCLLVSGLSFCLSVCLFLVCLFVCWSPIPTSCASFFFGAAQILFGFLLTLTKCSNGLFVCALCKLLSSHVWSPPQPEQVFKQPIMNGPFLVPRLIRGSSSPAIQSEVHFCQIGAWSVWRQIIDPFFLLFGETSF